MVSWENFLGLLAGKAMICDGEREGERVYVYLRTSEVSPAQMGNQCLLPHNIVQTPWNPVLQYPSLYL